MLRINKTIGVVSVAVMVFLATGSAYAVSASPTPTPTSTKVTVSCSNLNVALQSLVTDVNNRKANLAKSRATADQKLKDQRASDDAKKKQTRKAADEKFNNYINNLLSLVKDNKEYTSAVNTYAKEMKSAISTYRYGELNHADSAPPAKGVASVDYAQIMYRYGMDTAIAGRRAEVDAAINKLATNYGSAVAKATAGCAGNAAAKTKALATFKEDKNKAVATYKASFKAAQDKYNNTTLPALKKTRDATLAEAKKTYDESTSVALNDLLTAFGVNQATQTTKATATFVVPQNNLKGGIYEIGLTVSQGTKVNRVEWYLGSMDKKNLKATTKGHDSLNYSYKWDVSKVKSGTYKWMARVYDNKGKAITVKSPDNKAFLEVKIDWM